ncbi:uncharacterized protein LOC114541815 [Dendronephthya gigantea]|uniref:uncharacterized protein LOC114541815 n=1 Tax=Dendronephthya gigantea TaxID=151771 RepID=UPI001069E1DB|nr:uncharacterized protein LOC114541815 [Dendronephthya gigantea]
MRRVFYEGRPNTDGQVFWFQDSRTGCEKQTVYFERIRQLDSELITKEQKHLVSAMERLKQLKYPRRKPFVLDRSLGLGGNCRQNPRGEKSEDRRFALRIKGKTELSLNAKQMEICVENKSDRQLLRPKTDNLSRRLRPIEDDIKTTSNGSQEIPLDYNLSRIRSNAGFSKRGIQSRHRILNIPGTRRCTREVPVCDVLFPSLPCIPNVGYKTNIEIENKLRILELANGEFQTCGLSNASRRRTCERRCETKGRLLGGDFAKQSDAESPPLPDILDEMSPQKDCKSEVEIERSETQLMDEKCDVESPSTGDARQPPPPTRVNSQKSTPETKSFRDDPLPVTIKVD